MRIISHDEDEKVRSVQLYGVDPKTVGAAVRMLVEEDRADHIDLNFGCPVPKVTRRGGGSALPWKTDLFRAIVEAATARGRRGRHPADHQDAQGHRRGPPHLHRRRADRARRRCGRRRAARAHRQPVLLGQGRLERDRRTARGPAGHSGARQRRHLERRGRRAHGRSRPASTASSSAAAARAGPGSSATCRPPSRARTSASGPGLGEVADSFYRHAELLVDYFEDEGKAPARHPQARGLVLQGLRGRRGAARGAGRGAHARGARAGCWTSWTGRSPYPGADAEGPAAAPASPKRPALPDGWLDSRELDEDHKAHDRRGRAGRLRWLSTSGAMTPVRADAGLHRHTDDGALGRRSRAKKPYRTALRARPRPRAALLGAAPARRQDPGRRPATDDFVRTRLTHSLEVAQVGRELGRALGCDPDVVDTACLAHDLGPPAVRPQRRDARSTSWPRHIGGFEGNAQTLRLLTRLETKVLRPDGAPRG